MSFNDIKTKTQSERGFTIVELLIVIVVIGILAAITIVSFNGVTAKANTTSAQAAASAFVKKAEAFNAETTAYPTSPADLYGAASTTTYQLTGVGFNKTAAGTGGAAPTGAASGSSIPANFSANNTVNFLNCASVGGAGVQYWNFQTSQWVSQYTGSANATNCPSTTKYVAGAQA